MLSERKNGMKKMYYKHLIGVSLFFGVMMASIVLAIFPDVARISSFVVCPSGKFQTASQTYSYKAGQVGVSRNFFCVGTDGQPKEIVFQTLIVTAILYAVIGFLFVCLYQLLKPGTDRDPNAPREIKMSNGRSFLYDPNQTSLKKTLKEADEAMEEAEAVLKRAEEKTGKKFC